MTAWNSEDLERLGAAKEIEITSPRADGSPRDPVTIWVVRVGDDLYIRSVRGAAGAWFQGAEARHEGHVEGGGASVDVSFEEADGLDDEVDDAYREKYSGSPSAVESITGADARATTLKLLPR